MNLLAPCFQVPGAVTACGGAASNYLVLVLVLAEMLDLS